VDGYVYVFVSKATNYDCIWCHENELPYYMELFKNHWERLYIERVPVEDERLAGFSYKRIGDG
jgi:hypothetical protein